MHVSLSIFMTLMLLEKAFFNDYYFCVPARARWTLSSRLTWIQSLMLKMQRQLKMCLATRERRWILLTVLILQEQRRNLRLARWIGNVFSSIYYKVKPEFALHIKYSVSILIIFDIFVKIVCCAALTWQQRSPPAPAAWILKKVRLKVL